jgi:hypothetical protein
MFNHYLLMVLTTVIVAISTFAITISMVHGIDVLLPPVVVIDVVLFAVMSLVHRVIVSDDSSI